MKSQKGFSAVVVLVTVVVFGLLAVGGWYVWRQTDGELVNTGSENREEASQTDTNSGPAADDNYQLKGELLDVTMAKTVRGVQTGGQSKGEAKARFVDGKYEMVATFDNLPDPKDDDFYEGWIVRRDPFKFISTGEVVEVNGVYTNIFTDDEDLTAFDFYVLTLEPNDGDPGPADHIVEGVMTR